MSQINFAMGFVKYLHEKYAYRPEKIVNDHPEFDWNVNTIKQLLKKIDETGSVYELSDAIEMDPDTKETINNLKCLIKGEAGTGLYVLTRI